MTGLDSMRKVREAGSNFEGREQEARKQRRNAVATKSRFLAAPAAAGELGMTGVRLCDDG